MNETWRTPRSDMLSAFFLIFLHFSTGSLSDYDIQGVEFGLLLDIWDTSISSIIFLIFRPCIGHLQEEKREQNI